MTKLVTRYFYTPGYHKIIDEVTDSCEMCLALKQLPKEAFSETTGNIEGFGTNFSADVIERNKQNILIVREKLSAFTMTKLIPDQKANTLQEALISLIVEFIPHSGTKVQVDCATSWATLSTQSKHGNSLLKRLNIEIDLGRHNNKNKNPISDNACREFHKEVLRLKPEGTMLTDSERAIVTANMNQRIRQLGLSSKEICFRRDLISNEEKIFDDSALVHDILQKRENRHNHPEDSQAPLIQIGHNVFLKNGKNKLKARELYKVTDVYDKDNEAWATIQKQNSQFRTKKYEVKSAELLLLPGQTNQELQCPKKIRIKTPEHVQTNDEIPLRTPRRSAIIARRKIANAHTVNTVKNSTHRDIPTHGYDYEKMIELAMYDYDETYYPVKDLEFDTTTEETSSTSSTISPEPELDDSTTIDSNPTYSSDSDTSRSLVEELALEDTQVQPPTAPKLPRDLQSCQNLDAQLSLPEVQDAISADAALGDLRHYDTLVFRRRRSNRNTSNPQDYALFHSTGKK